MTLLLSYNPDINTSLPIVRVLNGMGCHLYVGSSPTGGKCLGPVPTYMIEWDVKPQLCLEVIGDLVTQQIRYLITGCPVCVGSTRTSGNECGAVSV